MRHFCLVALLLALSFFLTAGKASAFEQPDTLGFAVGYYDALENEPRNESTDFRLEYRFGMDLLQEATDTSLSWFGFRPFVGLEATTDEAFYALGGFIFDFAPTDWLVISPNVGVGLYHDGDGKNLGSYIEFRSTIEAGVRFPNESRLTAALGHISNAGITDRNSGTEIVSLYYHFPVSWVFGN